MFPSSSNVLWFLSGAFITFFYVSSSVETDNTIESTLPPSRHASTQTETLLTNYVVVEYV